MKKMLLMVALLLGVATAKAQGESVPYQSGMEFNLTYSLPRHATSGTSNNFGVEGLWKQWVDESVHFNAGLSLAFAFGSYNDKFDNLDDVMMEVGVPLSFEFGKIDKSKASLYGGVGITPTYYYMLAANADSRADGLDNPNETKYSGLYIAPRLNFGGYLPMGGKLLKLGVFCQYNLNCSKKDGVDVFKDRIGRFFVGASIGMLL